MNRQVERAKTVSAERLWPYSTVNCAPGNDKARRSESTSGWSESTSRPTVSYKLGKAHGTSKIKGKQHIKYRMRLSWKLGKARGDQRKRALYKHKYTFTDGQDMVRWNGRGALLTTPTGPGSPGPGSSAGERSSPSRRSRRASPWLAPRGRHSGC